MKHRRPNAGRVAARFAAPRSKTACVIGAGEFEGRNCLLKVRDRNYVPAVRLIRDLVEGIEVAYLLDVDTDWSEGLNEHGIAVVSSALMVIEDETVKKERTKAPDGIKIRKILGEETLGSAVNEAVANGVTGHTFIASPTEIATIEMDGEHPEVRILDTTESKVAVRTNHGEDIPEAGYTEGPDFDSSKSRKQQAEKYLHGVKTVAELGITLPAHRMKDRHHPNNMIRDTENMFTSSIAVVDPDQLMMALYLPPGKIDFYGIENRLPKGHTPKIKLDIFAFSGSEWEKEKPSPTLIPGDLETFRLFTFGSLMGEPSFPKQVLRSYAATLPGHHRAYNRASEGRGGTLVIGTEPGGSLEGVVHEYPVEIAQRLLGQVDRREGFDRSLDDDKNAYLRGYYPVQEGDDTQWVVAYLSNPESKNYFDPLSPAEAAKRIEKDGKAAVNYLRGIEKAMQKHKVTDSYLSKVLAQMGDGKTASRRKAAVERVFHSPEPFTKFRPVAQGSPMLFGKPNGLWYSCGSAWQDWVEGEMPGRAGGYAYQIEIRPSKMLLIKNAGDFLAFEQKYLVTVGSGLGVDWKRVARDYSGIEICPYQSKFRMESDWYYPWDVASGCIWGAAAISSIVPLNPASKVAARFREQRASRSVAVRYVQGG